MKKITLFSFFVLLILNLSAQQTVWLKDGTSYRGEIVSVLDTSLLINESRSHVQYVLGLNNIKCIQVNDKNYRGREAYFEYFVRVGLVQGYPIPKQCDSIPASNLSPSISNSYANLSLAGDELIKASKLYYSGLTINIIGGSLVGVGAYLQNSAWIIIGSVVILAGTITQIVSYSHIGKAGRKLKMITIAD